jgi:site-specific DNA recombinase
MVVINLADWLAWLDLTRPEAELLGRLCAFGDLARGEKLHRFYLTQLLRLAYLAPDITAAILDGRQPARLTATRLIGHPSLPLSWAEQRKTLGFPNPT